MERWDAYHADGTKAEGWTLIRGEGIPEGLYHLVSEVLVQHQDGDYLLMQRDPMKPNYGGYWEATAGGSALRGEDALTCAWREMREETGIAAGDMLPLGRHTERDTIYQAYLCRTDWDKAAVTLQAGETVAFRWVKAAAFPDFLCSEEAIPVQAARYWNYLALGKKSE